MELESELEATKALIAELEVCLYSLFVASARLVLISLSLHVSSIPESC